MTSAWKKTLRMILLTMLLAGSFPNDSRAVDGGAVEATPLEAKENAAVLEKNTMNRFYDPVEIRGEILKDLLGKELSHMRLYSFSGGLLHQVPYQFDEWTSDGFMVVDLGPEANTDLGNGLLDKQDMLVFMARDSGDRVSNACWPEGVKQGVEIEVLDPLTKGKGWYYLLFFNDHAPDITFSNKDIVEYDEEFRLNSATYVVHGTNRRWKGKLYKLLSHKQAWTTEEAGGDGKNLIDRLKYRFKARLLFGTIKLKSNEDKLIGEATKIKTGPVRNVARQWIALTLPLGLKSPRFYSDSYCYDTLAFTAFQTDMPFNPGYVVTDFRMIFGHDMHPRNAFGMTWYNSNNTDGYLIDGVMSPMETRHDDSKDTWRCTVGPGGWSFYRSVWDEFYSSQADIKVHYSDDRETLRPPEYYPGDIGYSYTESTVKSLKPRKYHFQVDSFVPYHFYDPNGLRMDVIQELNNIRDHPIQVAVGSTKVTNTSWYVNLIEP